MWIQKVSNTSTTMKAIVMNTFNNQHNRQITTKEISNRLKSVRNLKKITQSMRMMSASRYCQAERDLKQARPFGEIPKKFYEIDQIKPTNEHPKKLLIAMLSERAILQPLFAEKYMNIANEISRKTTTETTFADASDVAKQILDTGFDSIQQKIIYKHFSNIVLDNKSRIPMFSIKALESNENLSNYDSIDSNVIKDYLEYSLASIIFYIMKENAFNEQSIRMTAMDNAAKNANEIIDDLLITFNRTRQSVITNELIN